MPISRHCPDLVATSLLSVSMGLHIPNVLFKWDHVMRALLCPVSATQDNFLEKGFCLLSLEDVFTDLREREKH